MKIHKLFFILMCVVAHCAQAQDTREFGRRGEIVLETYERLENGQLKPTQTKVRVFAGGKDLGEFQTPRKMFNFIAGQWVFSWSYKGKPKTAKGYREAGEATRFRIVVND